MPIQHLHLRLRPTRHAWRTKWWMRHSLSHPPERIISGFDLREPLHTGGVDFRDPVLERGALNLILYLAIPQGAFKGDELPLLESLGELREIPPGIDAMPFGAGFVVAFVVFPAFLGCDVEGDVLFVVLSGFGFCVLPEAADEDDFVDYVELGWFCPARFRDAATGGRPNIDAGGEFTRHGIGEPRSGSSASGQPAFRLPRMRFARG
jgi:hypothetical protein